MSFQSQDPVFRALSRMRKEWPEVDPRNPHHQAAYIMLRETGARITAKALRTYIEDHPI